MHILGPLGPGYTDDVVIFFFANLDRRFFDLLCINGIFHTALWPSPLVLLPGTGDCAKFRWQGFSAGRFRSGSVTWKMDEIYWNMDVSVQSQNLQIHRDMMVLEKVWIFWILATSETFGQMEARKPLNRIWGDPMKRTCTRCFVATGTSLYSIVNFHACKIV